MLNTILKLGLLSVAFSSFCTIGMQRLQRCARCRLPRIVKSLKEDPLMNRKASELTPTLHTFNRLFDYQLDLLRVQESLKVKSSCCQSEEFTQDIKNMNQEVKKCFGLLGTVPVYWIDK